MFEYAFLGGMGWRGLCDPVCVAQTRLEPLSPLASNARLTRQRALDAREWPGARRCSATFLVFFLTAVVFANAGFAQIQIVNCDAPVQSRKRGIAVNSLSDADFRALEPGVSWYYNWGATPLAKPADVVMDFLPMAWNGSPGFQTSIASYLAAGNRPWRVLALNEPNLAGQAFMTPLDSANTFLQVKAICDPYNIPVIAPHMAIGSAPGDSITAYDPIQETNVTYTFQEPFLDAFLYYCGATPPTGMATHSYGGYGEITWILSTMHADYPAQKIWMTEFCLWSAASDAEAIATLIPAVDYCERMPWVEGYSWFMARFSNPYNSLLDSSGVLTPAGEAYVQMPVHDTNLFYRIPGRLQAERYVTMNQMEIAPTTDANGLADMKSTAAGGSLDFNVQVDSAGSYPLSFRVNGATGLIRVFRNNVLVGTASATQSGWSTVSTTVSLPAGPQTLHVVLYADGQQLNWMEFQAANGTVGIPTGLSAAGGNSQVSLSWSAASGATQYNVKRSTTNGGPYLTIASPATTNYTDIGLTNGTIYYYVVSGTDGIQESADSIQVSATPSPPTLLVSLNKPVTVSSTESGFPGSNAVDGNPGTRWASGWSDPQWIYVDLEDTYEIAEVKLNWEAAYGTSYQIQVSSNALNWTSIYSTTTGGGGLEDLTGLSGTGRYVRMYGTARGTPYGYSLWEMEVHAIVLPSNQPPVLASIADQPILAGRTLWVTNSASDPDVPPQSLTYSVENAPVGASIDANSGLFTWRPTIAQSPLTQTVAVVVSDNGAPILTATQSFELTVIQPAVPTLSMPSLTNGQFGFWINGDFGPDYTIQASSNLTDWLPLFTTPSPSLPYFWVDSTSSSQPFQFYRVQLGP